MVVVLIGIIIMALIIYSIFSEFVSDIREIRDGMKQEKMRKIKDEEWRESAAEREKKTRELRELIKAMENPDSMLYRKERKNPLWETEDIRKFMEHCFMSMMVSGKFSDEGFFSSLGSIVYVLKESGIISEGQKRECILAFFCEYNLGVKDPMSKEYIEETLTPHIINLRPIDLRDASFYIDSYEPIKQIKGYRQPFRYNQC